MEIKMQKDVKNLQKQFENLKLSYGDYLNLNAIALKQGWSMENALKQALYLAYGVMAEGCHSVVRNNHLDNTVNWTKSGQKKLEAEFKRYGIDPIYQTKGRCHDETKI